MYEMCTVQKGSPSLKRGPDLPLRNRNSHQCLFFFNIWGDTNPLSIGLVAFTQSTGGYGFKEGNTQMLILKDKIFSAKMSILQN